MECVITGYTLTLSVLEEYGVELQVIQDLNLLDLKPLTTKERTKLIWNKSEIKELLQQLQGHKSSITLLLTIAQK